MLLEIVVSIFLILGAFFALAGSIGLYRLQGFFERLHAPTKATTLGVGGIALASALYFSCTRPGLSLHEILITFFLFITAPISAHMLARVARHRGMHAGPDSQKGEQ